MQKLLLTLLLLGLLSPFLLAENRFPGDIDTSFQVGAPGMNGSVLAMARQKDGKILIGGSFTVVQGQPRKGICRLLSNGVIDLSFNPVNGFDNEVNCLLVQPDGKILVGGAFEKYNDFSSKRLIRLKPDASVDGGFKVGDGVTGSAVYSLAQQADGRIYIGGEFSSYNSIPINRIARLLGNGDLDTDFNPGVGPNNTVRSIIVGSGATPLLFIGGDFSSYAGTARGRVARVNLNGTLDAAAFTGTGADNIVRALLLDEANGKLYVAGSFLNFNGVAKTRLARLATTGNSVDADYGSSAANTFNNTIRSVALTKTGRLLVGGNFTQHISAASRVALLDASGLLDSSFTAGSASTPLSASGPDGGVNAVLIQSDGRVMLGGIFANCNGLVQKGITMLSSNGVSDSTFFRSKRGIRGTVYNVARQRDGKLLVGGDNVSTYASEQQRALLRLNKDGSLDKAFKVEFDAFAYLNRVILQPDGKILIGGGFTSVNGQSYNNLARLNANGTVDTSFSNTAALNNDVYTLALRPDGKILVGGQFTLPTNRIIQLNSDGTVDSSFNVGSGCNNVVYVIKLAPDGKVYLGGAFTSVQGSARQRIALLSATGTLDTTFNTSSGADDNVWAIELNNSGSPSVWIGGSFTTYAGVARRCLALVNSTGGLSTSFTPPTGPGPPPTPGTAFNSGTVYDIIRHPDISGVIVAGTFTSYNGVATGGLCHVYSYGAGINTFSRNGGMNGSVYDLEPSPDGGFYVGGDGMEDYNDTPVSQVVKLRSTIRPQTQTFTGVVQPLSLESSANTLHLVGKMTLTMSATGSCTGSIATMKERINVLGLMGSSGYFAGQATTKSGAVFALFMNMQQDPTNPEGFTIAGNINDTTLVNRASFQLYPPYYSKKRPASSLAGRYHLQISQPYDEATAAAFEPFSGSGYITWKVSSSGNSSFVGKAVDGSVMTGSGPLNYFNNASSFIPLYQSRGFMTMQLGALHGSFSSSDVAANMSGIWFRLPDSSYPSGYALNMSGGGFEYTPKPANRSPFGTLAAPVSARLLLYAGHAPAAATPLNADLKFALSGVGSLTGLNEIPELKISVDRAKGTFSGSFLPTGPAFPAGATKRASLQGIITYVNNQDGRAEGYATIDIAGVKKISFVSMYPTAVEP